MTNLPANGRSCGFSGTLAQYFSLQGFAVSNLTQDHNIRWSSACREQLNLRKRHSLRLKNLNREPSSKTVVFHVWSWNRSNEPIVSGSSMNA